MLTKTQFKMDHYNNKPCFGNCLLLGVLPLGHLVSRRQEAIPRMC